MSTKTRLDRLLGTCLSVLLALMLLDVLWGVLTRYALGAQAAWTEELARFLLIWIGLLGAAYVSGQRAHLNIDLLPQRLAPPQRRHLERLTAVLVGGFALVVLVLGGGRLIFIVESLGQRSPALRLPIGWVYAVLPISGLLVLYYQTLRWRAAGST